MVNRRRRKNRKWVKVVVFLVLLFVAGLVCYLVWDAYFKDEGKVPVDETEVVEKPVVEEKPDEEERGEDEEPKVNEEPKQYEGEDPNEQAGLTGIITYAEVLDGILRVRVNIDQFVSSGSCELSLVREGVSIYNTAAEIEGMVSTATCRGFDVPVSNLGAGAVNIVVNVASGEKTGVIYGEATL